MTLEIRHRTLMTSNDDGFTHRTRRTQIIKATFRGMMTLSGTRAKRIKQIEAIKPLRMGCPRPERKKGSVGREVSVSPATSLACWVDTLPGALRGGVAAGAARGHGTATPQGRKRALIKPYSVICPHQVCSDSNVYRQEVRIRHVKR